MRVIPLGYCTTHPALSLKGRGFVWDMQVWFYFPVSATTRIAEKAGT